MTIFLIGLSHRTAPVELRECLHLSDDKKQLVMEQMRREAGLEECVVLSTCNRFEVYGVAANPTHAAEMVIHLIERDNDLPVNMLSPYLYRYVGHEAVLHLGRVAAGLDSMVLGEAQILGQVSGVHSLAHQIQTSGTVLHRLFEMAVHAGKRAHNETDVGSHTTSISHAAVILAASIIGQTEDIKALVIGAGKMSSLAIDALRSKGIDNIDVVNRTESHAYDLASRTDGRAYGWHELDVALASADIVLSATSAPHTVIHKPIVESAMNVRNGRIQVLIDTAVPRDIEDAVKTVSGVVFYNIDDLQQVVDENYARREACIPIVEAIIAAEAEKFLVWMHSREVVPAIKGLREKINAIATAELAMALPQLSDTDQAVVEKLVHRIVNKVLHEPTVRLREQAASASSEGYVSAVRELFALDVVEELHG